jgi:NAD(P)-dependent dehydrogenase (short-subunit alcohol dehydrogenase family)
LAGEEPAALVTGASRGIGRAIALELADAGYDVAVNYVENAAAAADVVSAIERRGRRARSVQADVGRAEDRERLLSEVESAFSRIDLLVNNAGRAPRARRDVLDVSEESVDEVLAVNLKGPFFLTQEVARWMLRIRAAHAERRLSIINISSLSEYAPSVARSEYCIAKAGMGMMTRLFALRLAEARIRVNEVRPGIIATDMTSARREEYDERIRAGLVPLRRWGAAEDIARAVRALSSGDFDFMTAAAIDVDGGFHVRSL